MLANPQLSDATHRLEERSATLPLAKQAVPNADQHARAGNILIMQVALESNRLRVKSFA